MSAATDPGHGPARLPAAELARLLGNAAAFAGDDTLPVLHAVRVRAADGQLTVAATDRHALLHESYPLAGAAAAFDVAAPLPAVRQIRQLLAAARKQDAQAVAELTVAELTVAELTVAGQAAVSRPGSEHAAAPRLRVAAGEMAVEAACRPGDYPDIDALLAREDELAGACAPGPFDVTLAPRLLARLAKVRTGDGPKLPRARLSRSGGQSAARPVHARLGERVRVLVMPISEDRP